MNIKWIPIDKDNLYTQEILLSTQEVLAINTSHDMLVGYIEHEHDKLLCDDGQTELHDVTHYIPVTELVKLLKLQTSGLHDLNL